MCYRRWRHNTEFVNVLDRLEEESNEMMVDTENEVSFPNCIDIIIYLIILFRMMIKTWK